MLEDGDFVGWRRLVGTRMGCSTSLVQAGEAFKLVSSEPAPDGVPGALEGFCGGRDPVLVCVLYYLSSKVKHRLLGPIECRIQVRSHFHLRSPASCH